MSKKRRPIQNNSLELSALEPMTDRQARAIDWWDEDQNLVLSGYAGTGKSYLACALALEAIEDRDTPFKKMVIIRSAVPSRNMGFTPGNIDEKASLYEEPYQRIINSLYKCGSAYEQRKNERKLEFRTTSYLRGLTFDRTIIIVDEIQNMSFEELDTIMTRVGEHSRIIFSGDYRQTDLHNEKEKAGLKKFLNIIQGMPQFSVVDFQKDDIVRSDIVRDYIVAKTEMNDEE